jgi:hypothetical protein
VGVGPSRGKVADAGQNFVVPFVLQLAVILALPGLSRREESNQFLGDYGVIYKANLHKLFFLHSISILPGHPF